jgi:hypothetical protein
MSKKICADISAASLLTGFPTCPFLVAFEKVRGVSVPS